MGAMPTLFTRIIQREIPATIVYEDELTIAFHDIEPKAPVHILVVPKEEVSGVAALPDDTEYGYLLRTAKKVAAQEGLDKDGYRLVINQGENGGQTVPHLHVHILGGAKLGDFGV